MKLATVRADGRTALAGLTDAGVLDLSGALPGAGDLDSVRRAVRRAGRASATAKWRP